MINYPEKAVYTYDDLVDILRILRAPGGCPWDREQTHESNRRNFLEEAYEAAEAFDLDDPELMKEELGDVLMQVLFNIHMEEEVGRFQHAGGQQRAGARQLGQAQAAGKGPAHHGRRDGFRRPFTPRPLAGGQAAEQGREGGL